MGAPKGDSNGNDKRSLSFVDYYEHFCMSCRNGKIFYKYIVKKTNPTTNEVEILWEELPNNAPNRHIVITSSGNFDIYDEKSKLSQEVTYDIK